MKPAIKVCGLTRPADARAAGEAGAAYGGLVLSQVGPRAVPAARVSVVADEIRMARVGVFVDPTPDAVAAGIRAASLDVVQLHGDESPELVRRLHADHAARIWKAIRVRDRDAVLEALDRYLGLVDGLLFDTFDPLRAGGTGETFRWELLASVRSTIPESVQIILAGGLRPENVAEAVHEIRPHVVDVSSGVEDSPGRKSIRRMNAFRTAVEKAL